MVIFRNTATGQEYSIFPNQEVEELMENAETEEEARKYAKAWVDGFYKALNLVRMTQDPNMEIDPS